jgi:hypothetical protein
MNDFEGERTLGIGAIVVTIIGKLWAMAQVDPSIGGTFVGIITQFGGLGLAVWLVYYHTTTTVPSMQRDFKDERTKLLEMHKLEIDEKRREYFAQLDKMAEQFKRDLEAERGEFLEALRSSACRYK